MLFSWFKKGYQGPVQFTPAEINALTTDGWDQTSQLAASRYLYRENLTDLVTIDKAKAAVWQAVHAVGSPLYTQMYRASQQSARKRLRMVLQQLGAVIDVNHFLQLEGPVYHFDEAMAPHSKFLKDFRADVQTVFKGDNLATYAQRDDEFGYLAQQVHLFRYQLDRHNINYIRQTFPGDSDYQKLLNYQRYYQLDFDYQTDATYHNRYLEQFTYPGNMKVQVPRKEKMSEFIVDIVSGHFVTEWDVLHQQADGLIDSQLDHYQINELAAVANTESFNYGRVHQRSHQQLDVAHPLDSDIRRWATQNWPYEHDYNAREHPGRYLDIVKAGGRRDVYSWQQVPEDQRFDSYQAFLAYCQHRHGHNPGFAKYAATLPVTDVVAELEDGNMVE